MEDNLKYLFLLHGLFFAQCGALVTDTCDENTICPNHKPFCSKFGCIFECPYNFYINGTTCVETCGDWFTLPNRQCESRCPDELYVNEELRKSDCETYLEKQCVKTCGYNRYINGSMCVETCGDWFISSDRKCHPNCPNDFFIREDITLKGCKTRLEKRCLENCGSNHYVFSGKCLKACPENLKYINQGHCDETCSDDHNVIRNFSVRGLLHHECLGSCHRNLFIENNYCVDKCSKDKFSFERNCVSKCPETHSYINEYNSYCVRDCSVSVNKRCVSSCPLELPLIFNKTCVKKCPAEAPLVDLKRFTLRLMNVCVSVCDNDDYTYYNKCVKRCPEGTYLHNKSCVHECPLTAPYKNDTSRLESSIQQTIHCVQTCKDSNALLNSICYDICPGTNEFSAITMQAIQYYFYNNTCIETCPVGHILIANSSWNESCQGAYSCYNMKWFLECRNTCPEKTYIYNNRCVESCPFPLRALGNVCVSTCPESSNITVKQELEMMRWRRYNPRYYQNIYHSYIITSEISKCVSSCEKLLYFNGTCVNACPFEYQYILEGKCVDNCPTNLVINKLKNGTYCLSRCPKGYVVSENQTCNSQCSTNARFILDGKCVDNCPNHLYFKKLQEGTYCLQRCPNDDYVGYNRTCVSKCPESLKYNFNYVCTDECPPEKPFGINTKRFVSDDDMFECIDRCEEDYLFKKDSETCIYYRSCDYPFIAFDEQCLERCPNRYGWFLSCFSKDAASWSIPVVCALLFVYIYMCHDLIKDLLTFLHQQHFPVRINEEDVSKTCVFRMLAGEC